MDARTLLKDTATVDALLLKSIGRSDQDALVALFDRYSGLIFRVALRVLRNPADAEDVMQEVLLGLWRKPLAYDPNRFLLPEWLAVVTQNRAIDFLRKRRPSDSIEDVVLKSKANPSREAEQNILVIRLHELMGRLPEKQCKTLKLAFCEDLTYGEIAEIVGLPLGTVKSCIRAGLMSLRRSVVTGHEARSSVTSICS